MIATGLVILGGVKSISKVCEKLIPLMAGLYILGCLVICVINGAYIPAAFSAIIHGAFNPQAVGGGFVGATVVACIRAGVSRGLFTNESGLGSAPIVDACAATRNPFQTGSDFHVRCILGYNRSLLADRSGSGILHH